MSEPITKQELIDASDDAITLEQVVNGADTEDVTSRLARTYPTLAKALRLIVQNGLLGATAFNLKSSMDSSDLVNNDYAVVTDDPTPANNGFYQKRAGAFQFLAWNPINQFMAALAAESAARTTAINAVNATFNKIFGSVRFNGYHDDAGNRYLLAIVDGQRVGFGVTKKLQIIYGGNRLALDRVIGIKDSTGQYALAVTRTGKVYAPNLVLPAQVTDAISSVTSSQAATSASLSALQGNFATSTLHDDWGNRLIYALASINGKLAFGITKKLEMLLQDAKAKRGRLPFAIQDKTGQTVFAVTNKGSVIAPRLMLTSYQLAQIPTANKLVMQMQMFVPAQYNHVVGDGQSLSIGTATGVAISTSQPYSNVTFSSGPTKAIGDSGYSPTITALVESNGVESPTSGALNGFVRRIVDVGGDSAAYAMLGTAAGVGGQRISALTDEALYVRLRQHIVDAKAAADAAGKTYAVAAITWIQGEADTSGTLWTRALDYYQRYLVLMTKIRDTAIGISGQSYLPSVYSYQTGAHSYYGKRYLGIAIAQWRASVERPDIVMASPVYRMPHASDNLHLTAEGSWLLGEYIARAMFWTLVKGQKWRPLEPIDVTWTSTHIDVRYHVPCKPIQLSTIVCSAATNQGFDVWSNGSVYDSGATSNDDQLISDAISSVTVLSDDTIRITLNPSATIPSDAVLSYGRGRPGDPAKAGPVFGARGNVVDSHGLFDIVTSPLANDFALYNVGVFFEHGRKNGFF